MIKRLYVSRKRDYFANQHPEGNLPWTCFGEIALQMLVICDRLTFYTTPSSRFLSQKKGLAHRLQDHILPKRHPRKNISNIKYPYLSTIMPAKMMTVAKPRFWTAWQLKYRKDVNIKILFATKVWLELDHLLIMQILFHRSSFIIAWLPILIWIRSEW